MVASCTIKTSELGQWGSGHASPRVLERNVMDEGTIFSKRQRAIEACLIELLASATRHGLNPSPVGGLMYLPDQAITWEFQVACNKVMSSLGVKQEEQ